MLSYRQVAATPPRCVEGADVLAQGGLEVLGLDEAQVLPARVAQHVAEGVDPAAAFLGEVDVVGGVIHLGLDARCGLEAHHRGQAPSRAAVRAAAGGPWYSRRVKPRCRSSSNSRTAVRSG